MFNEIAASLQNGNPYVYVMIGLGFLACVITFERIIMLQFVYHYNFKKFLNNLKKILSSDDTGRAVSFCKSVGNTSLPYIARKALEAAESDPTTVRGVLEEETVDFLPRIENRLGVLVAISTLILLTGVLGAIDSLWTTFQAVAVLDTAKKQASLGRDIAGALNPAAFGIFMSMIALIGYYIARSLAMRLIDHIHYGITVLHNLLVPNEVSHFMPVAMPNAGGMSAETQEDAPLKNSTPPDAGETNAKFDTASVEDIRDEEEII
jgi:biopolymer transport protein ExbB/TolQ